MVYEDEYIYRERRMKTYPENHVIG